MKSFITKIRGQDWTVRFGNPGRRADGSYDEGRCDEENRIITLRKGRRLHVLSKDLAHEVTHATVEDLLDEKQVRQLEAAHAAADKNLLKFISENPGLVR